MPSFSSPQPIGISQALSALPVENTNVAFENSRTVQPGKVSKKKHRVVSRGLVDNEFTPELGEVFIGRRCDDVLAKMPEVSQIGFAKKELPVVRGRWDHAVKRVSKLSKVTKDVGTIGVAVSGKRISSS